jgi:NADPH:quinone reductase-like Zn-dependent oxidoreductase
MFAIRVVIATVIVVLIAYSMSLSMSPVNHSTHTHTATMSTSATATAATTATSEVKSEGKSRILIVGAAGNLGRAIVQSSLRAGVTTSVCGTLHYLHNSAEYIFCE